MSKPMSYERSRTWVSAAGRRASIYGALPWYTQAQRDAEGWRMVTRGWVPCWADGTVGAGRQPHGTLAEARAFYGAESKPDVTGAVDEPCADCGTDAGCETGEEVCHACHKARQEARIDAYAHGQGEPH